MTNQDYNQKKAECWEEASRCHGISLMNGVIHAAFNFAFDRAYALGKLQASCRQVKEIITQEEIEKASVEYADKTAKQYEVYNSEFVQEIMVAFEQGANFALGKRAKDADTVIQGWVAKDNDSQGLYLYSSMPTRGVNMWNGHVSLLTPLDANLYPNLTWDSEPQEVELIIKRKKK